MAGRAVRRVLAPAIATVVTSAVAVAINFATEWKTNLWAWLVVVAGTVLAAVVAFWLDRRYSAPPQGLADIADSLAIAVRCQWNYEAERRRLNDPYPVSVRWGPSDSALVANWQSLVRLVASGPGWPIPRVGTWAAGPVGLAGSDNEIVDVLGRVPTGRLVVLGEPGAGKTILLVHLVLGLLSRRRPGEAVPVLFPLASWDPASQDLRSWIVQWLVTDHSALAEPAPDGMGVSRAQALLDAGLILPVLDGLDEISDAVRSFAISRINDAMRPGEPLVLAARIAEYQAAICSPDGVEVRLTGAASITLCPLDVSVVSDYLRDSSGGSIAAAARWDEVLATFSADSTSPVAQAFTTPLMVALARVIYNPRPGEALAAIRQPAELLNFPTCEAVKQHLFDMFVPAAYRPHPDPARRSKWTADQAQRWLVFLARDLQYRQGDTNFAWWRLSGAAPRPLAGISVGLVAGLAGALGFPFSVDFGLGLTSALLVGLLVRCCVRFDRTGLTNGLVGGLFGGLIGALGALAAFGAGAGNMFVGSFLAGGLAFGIAVAPLARFTAGLVGASVGLFAAAFSNHAAIAHGIGATFGPVAHLVNGFAVALGAGLAVGLADRGAPARGLRWSPVGFVCGLASGLLVGFAVWIQVGFPGGLLVGLASMIVGGYSLGLFEAASADLKKAVDPKAVLVRDRATFRSSCLGLGLAIGLSTGLAVAFSPHGITGAPHGFGVGLGVGLVNLIAVGLAFGFWRSSWGSFTLARWWLAASRQLPWRLMMFLADAHEHRGVLRQVGAVYQFRHVELQRHLANDQRLASLLEDPAQSCLRI